MELIDLLNSSWKLRILLSEAIGKCMFSIFLGL